MAELPKNYSSRSVGFVYAPEIPLLRAGVSLHLPGSGDYMSPVADALVRAGVIGKDLADWMRTNIDRGLQTIIDQYDVFYAVKVGEEVSVYSRKRRQRLPKDVARRLLQTLAVDPRTPAGWYPQTDGNPFFTTVGELVFGEPASKVSTPTTKNPLKRESIYRRGRPTESATDVVKRLIG